MTPALSRSVAALALTASLALPVAVPSFAQTANPAADGADVIAADVIEAVPAQQPVVQGEARIEVEAAVVAPDYGGVGVEASTSVQSSLISSDLWKGLTREQAAYLAQKGQTATGFTALDQLAALAVASGSAAAPRRTQSQTMGEDDLWLTARVNFLLVRGQYNQVIGLGDALGRAGRAANPGLEWHYTEAMLWKTGLDETCKAPDRAPGQSRSGGEWQLLDAACKAAAGDNEGAEFAADLARELGAENSTAFALLDHMNGLGADKVPSELRAAATKDALGFAIATALKIKWTRAEMALLPPAVLPAVAGRDDLAIADRVAAAELARQSGFGTRKQLRGLYEQAAALVKSGDVTVTAEDKPFYARAVAYARWRSASDPKMAADNLARLLQLADNGGTFKIAADLVLRDFSFPDANPDMAGYAALFARACLAVGMQERAGEWLAYALQGIGAGPGSFFTEPQNRALWPYLMLSSMPINGMIEQGATAWLASLDPELRGKAAIVLSAAEAFGRRIPEAAWQSLQSDGSPVREAVTIPALPYWRGVAVAAAQRKKGEAILLSSLLLAPQGGAGAHPAILTSVLSALINIDAGTVAHQVAIDAALQAGF